MSALRHGDQAFKAKNYSRGFTAYHLALLMAEKAGTGVGFCGMLKAKLAERLDGIAEYAVIDRAPEKAISLFIHLADHQLNFLLLDKLKTLSRHEAEYWKPAGGKVDLKTYAKKNSLRPALVEALVDGRAHEAECEFLARFSDAFQDQSILSYHKRYVERNLETGQRPVVENELKAVREEGLIDRDYLVINDRLRQEKVEEYLRENPSIRKELEKLFSQLRSRGASPQEVEGLIDSEIRLECLVYMLLRLCEGRRLAAYQTADRLLAALTNGWQGRVSGLKFGIFGRILNDAIQGEKLSAEEVDLLKQKALLRAYREYNPKRMEAFLALIFDSLAAARRGEKVTNLELLKSIHQQVVLEAETAAEEGPLVIKKDDGTDFPVNNEADCLSAGWSLVSWGKVEEALEFGRRYSRSHAGIAGYEVEVLALTELQRYEEAWRRLVEVDLLLNKEMSLRLRQAIVRRESYFMIEAEEDLKGLICQLRTVRYQGKKAVLRGFERNKMNGLLFLADHFPKYRAQIFDKLADFFAEQAATLEGLPAAVGFVYGLLKEFEEKNPLFAPLKDEFERIMPAVHGPIMDFLRGNRAAVVEVGTYFLSPYAKVLANMGLFLEAAEVLEIFLPQEREGETLDLLGINTLMLCAINYGNSGREDKARALHLRLMRFLESGRAPEVVAAANKVTDYTSKNYALLANLHTDPAEVGRFVELALKAGPRSETSLTNITSALVFLKRYEEAEDYARSTLLLNPFQGSANFDLAKVLMETGREREVWEIVTLFEMKDRDAVPRIVWLNCILFRMSTEFGYAAYGEALAGNRAAYPKEKMAAVVRGYPGMFLRRLPLAFLDYLGV